MAPLQVSDPELDAPTLPVSYPRFGEEESGFSEASFEHLACSPLACLG